MRTWRYLAACAAMALGACSGEEQTPENVVPTVTRDAQLLYTIETGTEWISAVGRDGQARASSDAARSFAATIAADHQALQSAFDAVAQSSTVQPTESSAGQELITNAQTARVGLQSLEGPAFDLAFVEGAIRLQQQLLSAIERDAAALQDSTLRKLAEQTRPTLQAHIQRGRQLLPELRAAESGTAAPQSASTASGGGGTATPARSATPQSGTAAPAQRPSNPAALNPPPLPPDTSSVPQPAR